MKKNDFYLDVILCISSFEWERGLQFRSEYLIGIPEKD